MSHPSLPLPQIRTDGGTQLRCRHDEKLLLEYSEAMLRGEPFPPLVVFTDGTDYWLADGFHRLEAARRAGWLEVTVDVRAGTRRDAVLYAAGANAQHGLRRTSADKRRAVQAVLEDPEWRCWSDREIAHRCAVDHKTVGDLRRKLSGEFPQIDRTVRRGDRVYQQQVRSAPAAVATAAVVPGPDAVTATPTVKPALRDVLRILHGMPPAHRAVYPEEWLKLGAHRLHCGAVGTEAYRRRAPRPQLAMVVSAGSAADARKAEELTQLAGRVAIFTTPAALPALLQQIRLPQLQTVAAVYEGTTPRRATRLRHWTPVVLGGHALPGELQRDLLRIPEPPREADRPFRPSGELLQVVLEQFTQPGETILAGDFLEELLLIAELTGRVCVAAEADVRRLGTAAARWEQLTGGKAELLVR